MKKLFYLCILSLSVIACKTTSKEGSDVTDAEIVEEFAKSIVEIGVDIRKPGDVADLLALSGTRFMPELVNDPMNYTKYLGDNVDAAVNIGIYLVDGLYQIAFDKKYEGYLSIAASKQLAISIGISEVLDEIVLERYGDGEHPSDSILNSVRKGLEKSELLLNERDQAQIFAAMLFGNYIEELHILFTNIFDYPVDLPEESKMLILRDLMILTGDQLNLLPDAIAIVDKYKKKDDSEILAELKDIQALRMQYQLTNEELAKLEPKMIFENEGFLAIYEKIKAIRAGLVATE